MSILDSVAAIRRATAQLGQPDGAGACLANVFKWFGSVQSIGPGAGDYDWAIKGWTYAPASDRHHDDYSPPAGVPVYYGPVSSPRWAGDRNYPCGDIGLSIGRTAFARESMGIFTDSPTGNTGLMSISARARQIGRPYLGWTGTFLGHQTSAGNAYGKPVPPAVIVTVGKTPVKIDPTVGDRMYAIRNNAKGTAGYGAIYALAPGFVRHQVNNGASRPPLRLQTIVGDARDIGDENTLKDVLEAFGLPREASDPNWVVRHANVDSRTYSALVAAMKAGA
ncbi:hypothetical protein [Curtobacterium sp. MCSS17_015]|uniref:hypothetical protein n=1 Tax=Curtobacterium sp. MCSS17_015 TaxID=2175666 RepID=UPI000DA89005|nr:hypothetical protein [Curtobacterium sp. MCSS17_015]WIB25439.1 hypothetical protein DEJ18_10255 [Curtobacterium sp. MCSS17_015]